MDAPVGGGATPVFAHCCADSGLFCPPRTASSWKQYSVSAVSSATTKESSAPSTVCTPVVLPSAVSWWMR